MRLGSKCTLHSICNSEKWKKNICGEGVTQFSSYPGKINIYDIFTQVWGVLVLFGYIAECDLKVGPHHITIVASVRPCNLVTTIVLLYDVPNSARLECNNFITVWWLMSLRALSSYPVHNRDISYQNAHKWLLQYPKMLWSCTKMTNEVENLKLAIQMWKPCCFFGSFVGVVMIVEHMSPSSSNNIAVFLCLLVATILLYANNDRL